MLASTGIAPGLKRYAAALMALVLFLTCLGGCRKGDDPGTVHPYVPTHIETPAPTISPVVPTKAPSPVKPVLDAQAVAAETVRLVSQDAWAVDFLINLTIDGEPIFTGSGESGLEEFPVDAQGYASFDALAGALDKIYISEDAYEPFFRYPIFGNPQIYNMGGDTYVYPHYYSNFEARIDQDTVKITELKEGRAVFTFNIINHDFFPIGSMSMSLTKDGWRLDESFFFYCMRRLDLLDIESSVLWEDNPVLDTDQNVGSAKRFTGDCMFYNIFIDDKRSSWDADSISELYALQGDAFRYLEAQAALFGHELRCIATGKEDALYLYIDVDIPVDGIEYYWLDIYFMGTEYGSVNGLLEAFFADDPQYDNYGLIFNVNKPGRSYAVPCNLQYDDYADCYAERAVIFYTDDWNYEYVLCAATIAHEILHLFGAADLYYPHDGEDIRKEIIMQYFPFELMHFVPFHTDDATISAFTAFRVGWRNTLPDQLLMFQAKG